MRIIFTTLLILISFCGFAQSKTDSVQQAQINKAVTEIINKTSVKEFQEFLYENMRAKEYDVFLQYYNEFIKRKYQQKK